jgi:hypothetical protein
MTLSQNNVAMMFSADGVLRNFFFFGDVAGRHSKHCRLGSGSGFWTMLLPLITRESKPQLPYLIGT